MRTASESNVPQIELYTDNGNDFASQHLEQMAAELNIRIKSSQNEVDAGIAGDVKLALAVGLWTPGSRVGAWSKGSSHHELRRRLSWPINASLKRRRRSVFLY